MRRQLVAGTSRVAFISARLVAVASLAAFGLACLSPAIALANDTGSAGPPPSPATSVAASLPLAQSLAADESSPDAGVAIDSFNDAFYVEHNGVGHYRQSTSGGRADFWKAAEMIEMVEDAYQRSGRHVYRHMIGALYKGFVARFGSDWMGNSYNDDIMWMVIACVRAYDITGNVMYRRQARRHFDQVYARAWSSDFGGGLWWTTARHEKNACVNAPAVIAACELSAALHDPSYLAKAKKLFAWLRGNLFDPTSGLVYDHLYRGEGGRLFQAAATDVSAYTYNQGTFIGAAGLLYELTGIIRHRRDARLALTFAHDDLATADGTLRSEGSGGDGGGFKGIFARWATRFTSDNHFVAFDPWFQQNAGTAWSHRNAGDLIDQDWSGQTADDAVLYSFDCSSAVVLLQTFTPGAPARFAPDLTSPMHSR